MFGIPQLLSAVSRLTASINRMADLFSAGCDQIESQLAHPPERSPAPELPPPEVEANGVHTATRKTAKGRA